MKKIARFAGLVLALALAGCSSAPEKRYPLEAEVISVEAPRGLIVVKHGEIPGLMPAMTMQYSVADPKQIENLQPGDTITAELVVSESKGQIKGNGKPSAGTSQLIPGKGDAVPDYALVNQDGKTIHLRDYHGRVLLVTFIYTLCPLPDFCPRMNENFREVQNDLQATSGAQKYVTFLSISFDPEHDTPAVLKHYAAIYEQQAKGKHGFDWQFAVPAAKDLPEIANFFGVVTQPAKAQIVHSLSTTVTGPDGKVQVWYDSNDWKPADAAQIMVQLFAKT